MLSVLTTKNTACSWSHIEALPCFILQHNLLTGSLQQNRAAVTHLLTATSSYLLLPISFRLTVKTSSLDSQYYINNTNMRKFGSETQWNTLLLITTALWETRCPLLIKSGSSRDFFTFCSSLLSEPLTWLFILYWQLSFQLIHTKISSIHFVLFRALSKAGPDTNFKRTDSLVHKARIPVKHCVILVRKQYRALLLFHTFSRMFVWRTIALTNCSVLGFKIHLNYINPSKCKRRKEQDYQHVLETKQHPNNRLIHNQVDRIFHYVGPC